MQAPFDEFQQRRVLEFVPKHVGHVEGIHRGALLGENFRDGDVEFQFGEHLRNRVEETDAILRFHFNDGARFGTGVVDGDAGRDGFAFV